MNTDIRLYITFKGHRKRRRLRQLLGDNSTDYIIDLWLTVAQDRPEGVLTGWDDADVALAAGWEGDASVFVKALISAGFLEHDGSAYYLHGWGEHQPWAVNAKYRSEIASKNAHVRWDKYNQHATGMQPACDPQCNGNAKSCPSAPSPSPSPSPIEHIHPKKDVSPIPSESDNRRQEIFDHWNSKDVIKHRKMTDKINRAIGGALGNYSKDEVVQAIDNYAWILASPAHWFHYKWTLPDFLGRGLEKFVLREVCLENYRNDRGGGNGHQQRVYGQPGNQPSGAFDDIG